MHNVTEVTTDILFLIGGETRTVKQTLKTYEKSYKSLRMSVSRLEQTVLSEG